MKRGDLSLAANVVVALIGVGAVIYGAGEVKGAVEAALQGQQRIEESVQATTENVAELVAQTRTLAALQAAHLADENIHGVAIADVRERVAALESRAGRVVP